MPTFGLPTFGTLCVWTALAALVISIGGYLAACARRGAEGGGAGWARLGRAGEARVRREFDMAAGIDMLAARFGLAPLPRRDAAA